MAYLACLIFIMFLIIMALLLRIADLLKEISAKADKIINLKMRGRSAACAVLVRANKEIKELQRALFRIDLYSKE